MHLHGRDLGDHITPYFVGFELRYFDGLLVQCAGRIVRAAPGKDSAEVHDYHDHLVPLLAVSLQRRMPGYTALRFSRG